MLVSDAMPPVGSQDSEFILMGKRVTVQNGICVDHDGTLAGTALDMASAVRNMVRLTRCSFAEACTMASATPAAFLGLEDQLGSIREGNRADLVIMDDLYEVRSSIIAGRLDQ
jgi:N-acetylglucosamine-6-phosphate deacetylase